VLHLTERHQLHIALQLDWQLLRIDNTWLALKHSVPSWLCLCAAAETLQDGASALLELAKKVNATSPVEAQPQQPQKSVYLVRVVACRACYMWEVFGCCCGAHAWEARQCAQQLQQVLLRNGIGQLIYMQGLAGHGCVC
jgi:hypothetical protein